MKQLKEVLQLARDFLEKHKIAKARFTAEVLLSHFLKLKRIELYMHFDRPLLEEELIPFRAALKRKITGEPLEYILGELEFYHCNLLVNPDVLIPRQETEILLDLIVKEAKGKTALDLCTGSGCLAIGFKKARPEIEVVGVDLSEKALAVAKKNAMRNQVEITFLQGDLIEPVQDQKFDLIFCNPPYISEAEYEELDASVKEFEPKLALTSGPSGYEFFERLKNLLPQVTVPGGKIFFEIGYNQGKGLLECFSGELWAEAQVLPDWAGHDRFFCLKMKENSPILQ